MTPLRQRVLDEGLTWLRTPYHHAAMNKGAGVDCIMLLVAVYAAVGLIPATLDPRPYTRDWFLHRSEEIYLAGIMKYTKRTERPQVADLALYKIGKTVSHGGIIYPNDMILHAARRAGTVELLRLVDVGYPVHSYWSIGP